MTHSRHVPVGRDAAAQDDHSTTCNTEMHTVCSCCDGTRCYCCSRLATAALAKVLGHDESFQSSRRQDVRLDTDLSGISQWMACHEHQAQQQQRSILHQHVLRPCTLCGSTSCSLTRTLTTAHDICYAGTCEMAEYSAAAPAADKVVRLLLLSYRAASSAWRTDCCTGISEIRIGLLLQLAGCIECSRRCNSRCSSCYCCSLEQP